MMVKKMTSEKKGVNEGVGEDGWAGGPLGEVQGGMQSQVTFSRECSCEHSGSQSKAPHAIYQSPDFFSLPSPCTGLQ